MSFRQFPVVDRVPASRRSGLSVGRALNSAARRRAQQDRLPGMPAEQTVDQPAAGLVRLLGLDSRPAAVGRLHPGLDIARREAAARVTGRRRVRAALRPESVEVDLILPQSLEVHETVTAGPDVEGNVQYVVGLEAGQVELEQVQTPVDLLDEADTAHQLEHQAGAAGQPLGALDACDSRCVGVYLLSLEMLLAAWLNGALVSPFVLQDAGIRVS